VEVDKPCEESFLSNICSTLFLDQSIHSLQ
jgi:hypothetical protein